MINRVPAVIRPLLIVVGLVLWAGAASAAIVVNTASDTINPTCGSVGGTCSLRDALTLAQGTHGWSINFAIGTGPQTINLMTNLPDIITEGGLDGNTQPGFAGDAMAAPRPASARYPGRRDHPIAHHRSLQRRLRRLRRHHHRQRGRQLHS